MRILNVTETYAPFYEFGGPPVKIKALAEGLTRDGHEVGVLTTDLGLEAREYEPPPGVKRERSPFGWRREENGVRAIYLPTWFRYRRTSWNPAVGRYCRARLTQFDVVHIFGLYDLIGPAVARACRKFGMPYVIEPIGMYVPIVRNVWLKRLYHAIVGSRFFAGASAIVATSEQEVDELRGGGIPDAKIILRRNGVVMPGRFPDKGSFRARAGIPKDALVVLFLGRLSEKKSPRMLLDSFVALPEFVNGHRMHLAFVGPDEAGMRSQLREEAGRRGVADRVKVLDALYGDEKWAAYRDSDLFVLPSQNENFGNTAAEAAAAGTAVVVTEDCGVAEHLRGVAGLAVPHDAEALTRAMLRILQDEDLRAQYGAAGSATAARLGWDGPVLEMEHLYKRLVPSGG